MIQKLIVLVLKKSKKSLIDKNKVISYMNKIFILFILISIILKIDIGKIFYLILFISVFLINQFYLISIIFLLIYIFRSSKLEKYVNFSKVYLFLFFLFFLSLNITNNIVLHEFLINLIYLVIIIMLFKKYKLCLKKILFIYFHQYSLLCR